MSTESYIPQKYVALYCRISVDKNGRKEGVQAQEKWGRAYAAQTWPGMPVEVFVDNNLSAAKKGVRREGFEQLREAILNREVAHVWAVEQSRFTRREKEWFVLADDLEEAGIEEIHTQREGVRRVRDIAVAITNAVNADERRRIMRRQAETLAEKAARGIPNGGKPFGYAHGTLPDGAKTLVVVPEEAEALRDAASKVLSGWSLKGIVEDWTARGLHGPHLMTVKDADGEPLLDRHGNPVRQYGKLTHKSVRSALTMPSIAGYRVHRGNIVGKGNWEPILDEDIWQQVRTMLSAPRIVRRKGGGTYPISEAHMGGPAGRKYLLTGLVVCDKCDAQMVGTLKQRRNATRKRSVPYLLCHPNRGGKACTAIMMEPTEEYVLAQFFEAVERPDFLERVAADNFDAERARITKELEQIEYQRGELAGMWARREVNSAEWQAARRALDEQLVAQRTAYNALPPPIVNVDLANLRESWADMPLDEQRHILRIFVKEVRISPRQQPSHLGFDQHRVEVIGLEY